MKTFVINLDKDDKRLAHMRDQLSNLGMDFERVPAVYGKDLSDEQMRHHFDLNRSMWRQARPLSLAEIGCALSHLKVYRAIVERGIPRALVLEDDTQLRPDTVDLLRALEQRFPVDQSMVCLLSPTIESTPLLSGKIINGYEINRFSKGYFTSAYVVTREAAIELLNELYPIGDVADCWQRLKRKTDLEILNVSPPAVLQDQTTFGSSTTVDIQSSMLTTPSAGLKYKFVRLRNILFGPLREKRWNGLSNHSAVSPSHPIDEFWT